MWHATIGGLELHGVWTGANLQNVAWRLTHWPWHVLDAKCGMQHLVHLQRMELELAKCLQNVARNAWHACKIKQTLVQQVL